MSHPSLSHSLSRLTYCLPVLTDAKEERQNRGALRGEGNDIGRCSPIEPAFLLTWVNNGSVERCHGWSEGCESERVIQMARRSVPTT